MNDVKFDFDDLSITPKTHTNIASRGNIDPYYVFHNGVNYPIRLPLMTAPMDTVVGLDNMSNYWDKKIVPVLPRTVTHNDIFIKYPLFQENEIRKTFPEFTFLSYGIEDLKYRLHNDALFISDFVLLDVANGHMQIVYDLAKEFKEKFPEKYIMVGNIANPDTYESFFQGGFVDFIRLGVGNGNACLTTKQTSIGYPKASLIHECYQIKKHYQDNNYDKTIPMIVADGGIKGYSDIIKALALGADYVMVGSLFNKTIESSGDNYLYNWKISPKLAGKLFRKGFPVKKHFYGMSTKIAQKKMGKTVLKTSEGVERYRKVEYALEGWTENFVSYLTSTMSYCDARNLSEFIGQVDFNLITENAFNRFNK
jgi:IMP dehydrogenase/GMP reductase